jgi:hypothetical protein
LPNGPCMQRSDKPKASAETSHRPLLEDLPFDHQGCA